MNILVIHEVEVTPREKIEYSFKYEIERRELVLDRVARVTRRSKVSTRWTVTELEGEFVPDSVRAAALAEAQERVKSI